MRAREDVLSTDGGAVDGTLLADSVLENNLRADDRLLALAAAVQSRSEHHLAEATVEAAEERSLEVSAVSDFEAVVGKGVHATVEGRTIHIGNPRYVESSSTIDR